MNKKGLSDLKCRLHTIMDQMGMAIKRDYGEEIAFKYQARCDDAIDKWEMARVNKPPPQ